MAAASEGRARGAGNPRPSPLLRRTAERPLRVALFSGNYNYIKDGVALTLDRLVRYLERAGIPVLIFSPVGEAPAFEAAGEVVPVPSIAIPSRSEYRLSLGLPRRVRERLAAKGIEVRKLEQIEPSMEDVFVALIEAEERRAA